MRQDNYPQGTTSRLAETDLVSPQTRQVLQERLNKPAVTEPSFFSKKEFDTLQAVCKRLLPQPASRQQEIDIAGIFDTNMKEGKTANGWRYDALPADEDACRLGLADIEETAQSRYGKAFHQLGDNGQDALLKDIQQGKAEGRNGKLLRADLFFKDLFASLAEIYYSHPVGRDEIGDASFADAIGWHHIQLNEHEPQEPPTLTIIHQ